MKNLWFLFSILILTLSIVPCSDSIECKDNSRTETAQHNHHEKHNHNSEQCTPFCICACCGIHIYQLQTASISFKKNLVFFNQKQQISCYSFIYNKKITLNIWQPPKIS